MLQATVFSLRVLTNGDEIDIIIPASTLFAETQPPLHARLDSFCNAGFRHGKWQAAGVRRAMQCKLSAVK